MIRLKLHHENRVVDVGDGLKVTLRPVTYAVWESSKATALRHAQELAYERGLIEAAGGSISGLPDGVDKDMLAGFQQMFLAQALAVHAVVAWEGVIDETGEPCPASEVWVRAAVRDLPRFAEALLVHSVGGLVEVIREGESSGSAPNGTTAEEPDFVGGAEHGASDVPMEAA